MATVDAKSVLADQVWNRLFGFFVHTRRQRDAALARLGLTPNESRSLYSLDGEHSRTMKDLATAWKCDASTATWSVDRLEHLGLAARHAHPRDRRVRLVKLTDKGVATKAALLEAMYAMPAELLALTTEQLSALDDILAHLPIGLDEFA
jgi:MarR family transcriptional regulator, organic hydroperoxide resistance regulator